MSEAFRDPEHLELARVIVRFEVEAGPAAEVGGVAAEVDGDVPYMTGEDANQLSLRMSKLVVQATEDATSGRRLIVLREGVGKAKGDEGIGVENFGEPASGIAMPLWLQNLYVAQRCIT